MLKNDYYHAKIVLKRIFFRFGRLGLKKSIDVTYCGLESGTVFERVTGVCGRICRFHSK